MPTFQIFLLLLLLIIIIILLLLIIIANNWGNAGSERLATCTRSHSKRQNWKLV